MDRLRGLGGRIELAARLGGDEFTAITAPCASRDEREWLVAAIADALMRPVLFQGQAIPVSVSIGATEIRAGEATEAALARADTVLYRAKRDGRGCCRLYDPRVDAASGAPAPEGSPRQPRGERAASRAQPLVGKRRRIARVAPCGLSTGTKTRREARTETGRP